MVSPFFPPTGGEKGGRGDEYMKNKAERGAVGVSTCSQRKWLTAQRITVIQFFTESYRIDCFRSYEFFVICAAKPNTLSDVINNR